MPEECGAGRGHLLKFSDGVQSDFGAFQSIRPPATACPFRESGVPRSVVLKLE